MICGINYIVKLKEFISLKVKKLNNMYADITAIQEKAAIYNSLSAMKSGEVYVQLPYNAYYTNIEILYII